MKLGDAGQLFTGAKGGRLKQGRASVEKASVGYYKGVCGESAVDGRAREVTNLALDDAPVNGEEAGWKSRLGWSSTSEG